MGLGLCSVWWTEISLYCKYVALLVCRMFCFCFFWYPVLSHTYYLFLELRNKGILRNWKLKTRSSPYKSNTSEFVNYTLLFKSTVLFIFVWPETLVFLLEQSCVSLHCPFYYMNRKQPGCWPEDLSLVSLIKINSVILIFF
jgi:hypothetical protein